MSRESQASRAEIVRGRRRQQAERRIDQSAALATRPMAVITSRTMPRQNPPPRMAPANARRAYQTALSMPGVEVRMPAISFTSPSLKWRLLSLAVSTMLGVALYVSWTAPIFQAAAPQVSGNARLSADEVSAVMAAAGQPIFTLVPAELERRVRLNYHEVQAVEVQLGLPNVVAVHVIERQPLIAWEQAGGYTWIDEEGVAFRPRGAADNLITVQALAAPPAGVPASNDPYAPIPYVAPDTVEAIKTLAPSVPAGSMLMYDGRYGLGWQDSRGWQIFFGTEARDMPLKLQVYQALESTLEANGIRPALISVQYANAPFYRMNP